MSVNVVQAETIEACNQAQVISVGQRVSGNASEASSSSLGSSCTALENSSGEVIYALQLDAPQQVVITATPQLSSDDVSISLRDRCIEPATESACVDIEGEGTAEVIDTLLGAGTHYVAVQAASEASLESFELTVEGRFLTTCAGDDDYCIDGQTANLCSPDGGRFDAFTCGAGCNPSTGGCFPPAGDRCEDADVISAENGDTTVTFNLRELNNDYELGADSCVGMGESRTGGPEQTYAVELPADTAVTASVSFSNEVIGSVYFSETCSDLVGTCATGAQDSGDSSSEEVLTYSNLTDSMQTRYLVIDTDPAQNFGEVTVDLTFLPVICTPAMGQCSQAGNVETCNEFGTAYVETATCGLACESAVCQGDACGAPGAPYNITQAASQSGGLTMTGIPWDSFTNQYQGDDTCDGAENIDDIDTEGVDVVFQIDLNANQAFTATISNISPQQASLYLKNSMNCGTTNTACLDAIEEEGDDVSVSYATTQAETIYMIADTEDDTGGTFDLSAQVLATCTPGTQSCVSGNVQYCPPSSVPNTFACTGGCTNGFCDTRNSEFCYDAENITTAANTSSGYVQALNLSNFANDIEFDACGGVSDFENDGPDAVYAIDLSAGDVLDATFDNRSSFDDPALMLLSGCGDLSASCLAGDEDSDTASLQYLASSAETVFLVADVDDPNVSDTFDLTVTVSPQQCNPATYTPTCDGSGNLQYCGDLGQFVSYTCQGGCTNGACGTPTGGICADAVLLADGGSGSNTYIGTNNIDPVANNVLGNCTFGEDTAGADWVYQVDLQANETLTASYNGNSCCDIMYVLSDCTDTSTCIEAADDDGSITYTAGASAETVYVVMDHDSYTNNSTYNYTLNISIAP
jgi:hypothetical protein